MTKEGNQRRPERSVDGTVENLTIIFGSSTTKKNSGHSPARRPTEEHQGIKYPSERCLGAKHNQVHTLKLTNVQASQRREDALGGIDLVRRAALTLINDTSWDHLAIVVQVHNIAAFGRRRGRNGNGKTFVRRTWSPTSRVRQGLTSVPGDLKREPVSAKLVQEAQRGAAKYLHCRQCRRFGACRSPWSDGQLGEWHRPKQRRRWQRW